MVVIKVNNEGHLVTSVLHKCIMVSSLVDEFLLKSNLSYSASVQPNNDTMYFLCYGDYLGHIKSKRN